MYGHGAAPRTRSTGSTGTVITLRVLFALAGFLTCGLLACVPLFRIAVLRGKWGDWLLAWVSLPVAIAGFAVIGSVPETDHRSDVALTAILLLGALSGAWFLVFDIRHHRALPPVGPMPHTTGYQSGYGYPPTPPYGGADPQTPPSPYTPAPPPPQPQRPAPARIDQVRAELDELSDYLRKHEDGR